MIWWGVVQRWSSRVHFFPVPCGHGVPTSFSRHGNGVISAAESHSCMRPPFPSQPSLTGARFDSAMDACYDRGITFRLKKMVSACRGSLTPNRRKWAIYLILVILVVHLLGHRIILPVPGGSNILRSKTGFGRRLKLSN